MTHLESLTVPASQVIGCLASYWMIDRVAGFWQVVDGDDRAAGKPASQCDAIRTWLFSHRLRIAWNPRTAALSHSCAKVACDSLKSVCSSMAEHQRPDRSRCAGHINNRWIFMVL